MATNIKDPEELSQPKKRHENRPFRIGKFYEAEGPLCAFQATLSRGEDNAFPSDDDALKGYIILDAHQQSFGVRFVKERPFTPKPAGALVATIRKLASGCSISGIYKQDKNYWVPLHKNSSLPPHLWILLLWASPPECHIVDAAGTSLMRKSQQGTYTKRKSIDIQVPHWPITPSDQGGSDLSSVKFDHSNQKEDLADAPQSDANKAVTLSPEQKEARDRVSRRLKTLMKSLNQRHKKSHHHPVSVSHIDDLERVALGLKSHMHLLGQLAENPQPILEIVDEQGPLKIVLEAGKSPGQWLDAAFENIRKSKRRFEIEQKESIQLNEDIKSYQIALETLRTKALTSSELSAILKPLHLKPKQKTINSTEKPHEHIPYRVFRIPLKSVPSKESMNLGTIYVGKSAADSDLLVKKAKGHDLWLHAVGTTGSHVVIPGAKLPQNTRLGRLDDPYFFAAAVLAHYYSKNRDAINLADHPTPSPLSAQYGGEVYFSTRQYIRKKKGMPPGLWLIDKAKTIHVKYSAEDLRTILNTLEGG